MPAPLEDRLTNLENRVARIIRERDEDERTAEAQHREIMEEFRKLHGTLDAHTARFDSIDQKLSNIGGDSEKHDEVMAKLDEIMDRLKTAQAT
ncbi:hypothetical protein ACWDSF_03295 [Nocardia beijingensis]